MADKFNEVIQDGIEAGRAHEPYAYAAALFLYHSEAGYRHIPYQIKYHGNIEAGEHFGYMAGSNSRFTAGGFVSSDEYSGAYQEATDKVLTKAVHS